MAVLPTATPETTDSGKALMNSTALLAATAEYRQDCDLFQSQTVRSTDRGGLKGVFHRPAFRL